MHRRLLQGMGAAAHRGHRGAGGGDGQMNGGNRGGYRETRSPRYMETQRGLKERKERLVNLNTKQFGEPSWGTADVLLARVGCTLTSGALKQARE